MLLCEAGEFYTVVATDSVNYRLGKWDLCQTFQYARKNIEILHQLKHFDRQSYDGIQYSFNVVHAVAGKLTVVHVAV